MLHCRPVPPPPLPLTRASLLPPILTATNAPCSHMIALSLPLIHHCLQLRRHARARVLLHNGPLQVEGEHVLCFSQKDCVAFERDVLQLPHGLPSERYLDIIAQGCRFVVVLLHPTPHTSHLTPHTSHFTPHTSHLTPHTSHLSPHTSHLTPHTSHLTPPTSHLTPHTSSGITAWRAPGWRT